MSKSLKIASRHLQITITKCRTRRDNHTLCECWDCYVLNNLCPPLYSLQQWTWVHCALRTCCGCCYPSSLYSRTQSRRRGQWGRGAFRVPSPGSSSTRWLDGALTVKLGTIWGRLFTCDLHFATILFSCITIIYTVYMMCVYECDSWKTTKLMVQSRTVEIMSTSCWCVWHLGCVCLGMEKLWLMSDQYAVWSLCCGSDVSSVGRSCQIVWWPHTLITLEGRRRRETGWHLTC